MDELLVRYSTVRSQISVVVVQNLFRSVGFREMCCMAAFDRTCLWFREAVVVVGMQSKRGTGTKSENFTEFSCCDHGPDVPDVPASPVPFRGCLFGTSAGPRGHD